VVFCRRNDPAQWERIVSDTMARDAIECIIILTALIVDSGNGFLTSMKTLTCCHQRNGCGMAAIRITSRDLKQESALGICSRERPRASS
jgi:hypothetical protein